MPRFYTRLIDPDLESSDEGADFETAEQATSAAVRGALDVAKELLTVGEKIPPIEVVVSDEKRVVSRRLVTVSIADLELDDSRLPPD